MSITDIKIYNPPIDKVEKKVYRWKKILVAGKLSKSIGRIIKAREYLNTLFYSFLHPYSTYCSHVWGCTYYTNLKQLFLIGETAANHVW